MKHSAAFAALLCALLLCCAVSVSAASVTIGGVVHNGGTPTATPTTAPTETPRRTTGSIYMVRHNPQTGIWE